MFVISEINDPSKEAKVRLLGNLGSTSCSVKSWKSGYESQQYFTDAPYHPLTIACVIPLMTSVLKVYVNKNIHWIDTSRWTFISVNHSSNECKKKEVVDIDKKLLVVAFLTNY